MSDEDRLVEIEQEILRYLLDRPSAADSADGIGRWWITRQRFDESMKLVEKALDRMTAKGELDRSIGKTGVAVYSRPKGKHVH